MAHEVQLSFEARLGHGVARSGNTFIVRIERSAKANCLDVPTCEAMAGTFDEVEKDSTIRSVILCGQGKQFCAGLDLSTVQPGLRIILPASGFAGLTARWLDIPVIAAVQGAAYGGGFELVLACDLVVADSSARFCLPEPRVGQAALAGGLERLPGKVGHARALDLALTGRTLKAEEARDWGLVSRMAGEEEALDRALELARELEAGAPLSLQASKAVIRSAENPDRGAHTRSLVSRMLDSRDAVEGARAYLEKRRPEWSGY